jgi:hypothetical protein
MNFWSLRAPNLLISQNGDTLYRGYNENNSGSQPETYFETGAGYWIQDAASVMSYRNVAKAAMALVSGFSVQVSGRYRGQSTDDR